MKFKHPNLLGIIEQPLEDSKTIMYVTEPIEFNLSSLVFDQGKKEFIPGDLEIKCMTLEIMEGLNFLHSNAKTIHANISPENIFITKEGRLKLGGFNFT
jgi:serine/threonine protein kinase